jgi:hypothetical protein
MTKDILIGQRQTTADELMQYRNIHSRKIGFLIGNGPSVKVDDLERLSSQVSFCCNRFHLAYNQMTFRPTYTLSCDRQMREDFGQEIIDNSAGKIFIASEFEPDFKGDYIWMKLVHFKPDQLFKKPIEEQITTGGSVIIFAIQVGVLMGIRRFYLYGVDHTAKFIRDPDAEDPMRSALGDDNHFIKNYRSGKPWCPQNTPQVEESFRVCDRFLRNQGGFIKNATRGGKLEVLERIDFEQVLKEHYLE